MFRAEPATGGDTGSHFWALWVLVKHAIPHGSLRAWSPGNLGGEPILVHYFPFPFLLMSLLAVFVPLGTAFNLGTVLPALLFPLSCYLCLRGLGSRFPAPILAAVSGLFVLFNESYSMYGGNFLSVLAGQFAHQYAIDFILLGVGALGWELRKARAPILSALCFAGVFLSHGYVFLGLPFFVLGIVLFFPVAGFRARLIHGAISAGMGVVLSLWFLVPLVSNAPWTTAFASQWGPLSVVEESAGRIFLPSLIALFLSLACLAFLPGVQVRARELRKHVSLWLVPFSAYLVLFAMAERLGVINIRAVPQLLIILSLITASTFAFVLRRIGGGLTAWLVPLPLVFLGLYWSQANSPNVEAWMRWNYSGWSTKPLYPDLSRLYDRVRGDFSMPRIIYESSARYNDAGTMRVFEMLPYFAGRATLEGVYLQSTMLAPMAFRLQAEVSTQPSCPYGALTGCPKYDVYAAVPRLRLMGVGEMLLSSTETVRQAEYFSERWKKDGTYGIWSLFRLAEDVPMAETFRQPPEFIDVRGPLALSLSTIKPRFIEWFNAYSGSQRFLVAGEGDTLRTDANVWSGAEGCRPTIKADFDRLELSTPCPGKAHYLKFAYHPSWSADSGDAIFLVSPGFLGIVPSKPKVTLVFGADLSWKIAAILSLLGLFALPLLPHLSSLRLRAARAMSLHGAYFASSEQGAGIGKDLRGED